MKSVLSALQLAVFSEQSIVKVSDASWPGDSNWKQNYNRIDDTNRDELQRLGEENRRIRAENKASGFVR